MRAHVRNVELYFKSCVDGRRRPFCNKGSGEDAAVVQVWLLRNHRYSLVKQNDVGLRVAQCPTSQEDVEVRVLIGASRISKPILAGGESWLHGLVTTARDIRERRCRGVAGSGIDGRR